MSGLFRRLRTFRRVKQTLFFYNLKVVSLMTSYGILFLIAFAIIDQIGFIEPQKLTKFFIMFGKEYLLVNIIFILPIATFMNHFISKVLITLYPKKGLFERLHAEDLAKLPSKLALLSSINHHKESSSITRKSYLFYCFRESIPLARLLFFVFFAFAITKNYFVESLNITNSLLDASLKILYVDFFLVLASTVFHFILCKVFLKSYAREKSIFDQVNEEDFSRYEMETSPQKP